MLVDDLAGPLLAQPEQRMKLVVVGVGRGTAGEFGGLSLATNGRLQLIGRLLLVGWYDISKQHGQLRVYKLFEELSW